MKKYNQHHKVFYKLVEEDILLSLQGLGVNLISPTVQLLVLVALHITADPSLREERRLQFALRRLDARSEYETAVSKGMAGRDLTGKGYISLDFFNLFWLFVVGCVFGLVVETLYHYVLFGEWQDRAGFLWGPFSPIYGFGAGFMTILLNRLWRSNWVLIFFSSALIGGVFEYCSSWFMEVAFGIKAWDYTGEWLSIGGRTSGKYMVFWGIMGLAWIKFVLPYLLKFINLIPWKVRYSLTAVVFVLLFIDDIDGVRLLVRAHGGACAGFADHAVLRRPFRQRFHGEPIPDHVHRPVQGRAHVGRGPCAGGAVPSRAVPGRAECKTARSPTLVHRKRLEKAREGWQCPANWCFSISMAHWPTNGMKCRSPRRRHARRPGRAATSCSSAPDARCRRSNAAFSISDSTA